MINSKKYVG
jgi:hypothetical protein